MNKKQSQRSVTGGSAAAGFGAATVMFVLLPRVDGVLRYVLGIAGTLTLLGAALMLFSDYVG